MSNGWKTLPFDDAIQDVSAGNPKLQTGEYLPVGSYPIVDQGKNLIAGYCDDQSALAQIAGPVIICDHTRVFKYVDFPFCVGAEGVKILKPADDIDAKYAFHFLSRIELPSAGYSRHFKYLKRAEIFFPPVNEQRRIAGILDQAHDLRRKRRDALEALEAVPQADFIYSFFLTKDRIGPKSLSRKSPSQFGRDRSEVSFFILSSLKTVSLF
jgi:type I restriction enzyme, S subunit